MERFYKKASELSCPGKIAIVSSNKSRIEINMANLHSDPSLRTPILDYNPNIGDEIQRHYLQQGPCQSKNHKFPPTEFGKEERKFNTACFE